MGAPRKGASHVNRPGELPAARAAELVEGGTADEMVMADRRMREWVSLRTPDEEVWRGLLAEAATYVESLTR
ncbi:hypothetical protein ACIBO5_39095 [Nonomuraea angiospora]|uniref:hypothetical protein n=1 Tax=Nonomuraea angiospora TaxID=46172 RepID=UPI0037A94840